MVVEKIYRVGNKVQFHRCGDSREIKGRIEKIREEVLRGEGE